MALIRWRDEYSTNVEAFDEEHKKLVELINQLYEARQRGDSDQILQTLFSDLTRYCSTHFQREEEAMERFNYADSDHHKKQHQDLTDQTAELQTQLKADMSGLSTETFKFLRHWLLDHIVEEDQKLGAFCNEQGMT